MSDTLAHVRRLGLAPSSRGRISVDLRGLKAALFDRAQALGMSPSDLVRTTLAAALGQADDAKIGRALPHPERGNGERVRLCLRMSRDDARATLAASRRAGLSPGDYVGGLVAGVPVVMSGGSRVDHIAALLASSAELSTLSRNVHRLSALLRQADVEPARAYREMLDTIVGDVHKHLELAACVLAALQPGRNRGAATDGRSID